MADTNGAGSNSLQHYVSALRELRQEQQSVAKAVRDLLAEAGNHGLNQGALKDIVKAQLMSREQAERQEERQDKYSEYLEALGMLRTDPSPRQPAKAPRARA